MKASDITPGATLNGRYRVDAYLNEGSMQKVYQATDLALNRIVVIKTPMEGIADKRFGRGAAMSARINHSNVAATFDYFENDELTFLVEEYVAGRDLGSRLESDFVFMDPALVAHVMHHVARAVFEAHRVGICHRDLKPSNIMTSEDLSLSSIKLTDFGIAKLVESEIAQELDAFNKDPLTLTSSSTLLGAVPYLAPECWEDWKAAGQPMDIWALGCICFHLLAGSPPFGIGRPAIGNLVKYQNGSYKYSQPSWFDKHPSTKSLEDGLWFIVNSCLAIDPQNRPNAQQLVKLFDELCYPVAIRKRGRITTYPHVYKNGGIGDCGFLLDPNTGKSYFFHTSEFFGSGKPAVGDIVHFAFYPGVPNPRTSPVLRVK